MKMPMTRHAAVLLLLLRAHAIVVKGGEDTQSDADIEQLEGAMRQSIAELTAPVPGLDDDSSQPSEQTATDIVQATTVAEEAADPTQVAEVAMDEETVKDSQDHRLLADAVQNNKKMRLKIEELEKQLGETSAAEKKDAAEVTAEKAEIDKEKQLEEAAEGKLETVEHKVQVEKAAMKILGGKVKKAEAQKNQISSEKDQQLGGIQAKIQQLEADNAAMKEYITKSDAQKKRMAKVLVKSAKRDQTLIKENHLLKANLNKAQEVSNNQSSALSSQGEELAKARKNFQFLHQRIEQVSEQEESNEKARYAAEYAAKMTRDALAESQEENKQLRRMVPILEKEVDEAVKERDGAKGFIDELKTKMGEVPAPLMSSVPVEAPHLAANHLAGAVNWFQAAPLGPLGPLLGRTQLPSTALSSETASFPL